jgi:diadenosine tetraphosphate (Ap4A) HIT family hydrolase
MGRLLFYIARLKVLGTLVGFAFAYFPFLVPVKKVMQNRKAVSFKHPIASYPNHILIIPRKIARNIFSLSDVDFVEIIDMAVKIRNDFIGDFILLINGGRRQDVMQAHFHLFSGNMANDKNLSIKKGIPFIATDKMFWKNILSNLRNLLKEYSLSEESFSILIQFENNFESSLYFI